MILSFLLLTFKPTSFIKKRAKVGLKFNIKKAKTTNTFMAHFLAVLKRFVQLNEAMSYAMEGHPRWTDHSEKF